MSDSIPIKLYVFRPGTADECFGPALGALLRGPARAERVKVPEFSTFWKPKHEWERRVEVFAGGGLADGFSKLTKQSGFHRLGFIGDLTCTHEVEIQLPEHYGFTVIHRYTVIGSDHASIARDLIAFIDWCAENEHAVYDALFTQTGNDLDGTYFDSTRDAIRGASYSLNPNYDFGSTDSRDGRYTPVAFSFLKTIVYALKLAQRDADLVVLEHWGGMLRS